MTSRAVPNQRLVTAFDIDNAFTTEDDSYAKAFKKMAIRKIELDESDWRRIASLAHMLVIEGVPSPDEGPKCIRIDKMVQSVSLKIALHVLFRLDPTELDNHVIEELAFGINELWSLSKTSHNHSEKQHSVMMTQKMKLQGALTKIFPDFGPQSSARDNPLNFIIPAYETLWRVVFFCFVEISFRASFSADAAGWRKTLAEFLNNPSQGSFEGPDFPATDKTVSTQDIVNEALRLYTPTRRIHRRYHFKNAPKSVVLTADLEALHRDAVIWGDQPLKYDPSRWQDLGEEAPKAFMPFGNMPFLCPAQKEFGPRIIGVLVAAFAIHINSTEWKLQFSKNAGSDMKTLEGNEQLDTDRKAYDAWFIYRKP